MRVAICLLLMPFFSWSQEITAVDYARGLEDVHSFKKRFFEVYPPKKSREFSKVVLAEREYTLYETLSAEVPYVLLSDKAISLGLNNDLALSLESEFEKYFENRCPLSLRRGPGQKEFKVWNCEGYVVSIISQEELSVLFIKQFR